MSNTEPKRLKQDKLIIKLCHKCGHCNASDVELERCGQCAKAFLPLNYFEKVHSKDEKFQGLFEESDTLDEADLIKGLYVLR